MKNTPKWAGAVTAACAACCAIAVVPSALVGTGLAAIAGAACTWGLGLLALAVPVGGLYLLSRRKAAPNARFQSLMAQDECGCGPSCASAADNDALSIACTLGASDFKERVAGIRALARRSLHHAERTALSLKLTYGREALEEVTELMRKEQTCCSFLTFDLKTSPRAVVLTIIAPQAAADAADLLFDHFAPELAASNLKEIA
ncbi:hypothetical protein LB577_04485 [Mesorhizobium sp. B283B1A]|uniref:hypothetical protein n=1 Tax=Mesorhizobium TaxID=68287 RepID=UPI001CD17E52|nr:MULTISPECIES: hypothetical protein [Mesorhizobium]MCA0046214.1 hypothetical protein [Mesorhizobium sp. B283B1A]UQS62863.1 hypothetical protein M5D98_22295 [Mesorhizobium opportunistum]